MNDRNKIQWQHTLVLLAMSGLLASCGLPPGMKLLHMRVHHGGECVLETNFDVPDSSTVSEIWDAAGRCPFSVVSELEDLPKSEGPEGGRTLVELDDSVAISITWTGELQAQSMLEGATVEMCSACCPGWHLSAETVRRAKEAAGL